MIEREFGDQLFAQMAARAFREESIFGVQFHAELEIALGLAFAVHAHVAGGHAHDLDTAAAVFLVQYFGGREAGEDFNAQRFGLLAQPSHDIGQ